MATNKAVFCERSRAILVTLPFFDDKTRFIYAEQIILQDLERATKGFIGP